MAKIAIKNAVAAGSWFNCTSGSLNYRFKISSFYSPRLECEIVNLNKQPLNHCTIATTILLVDQWGYEFYYDSCDFKGYAYLNPKIKYVGTICYRLPEEETEYYLSVKGGSIQEV